ncbi:ubiquinone anaerobic biosynthesis accessory factor UbiT [Shewanella sp. HL-SH5]|uniref:ubiquinone anaerobic biosynthesis accessory factor UbiT n=1 Tax=Shewanella sp. HL-SH5 TaxID=3436241 RepID=UPI003EBFB0C5
MLNGLQQSLSTKILTSAPVMTRHSLAIIPKRFKREVITKLINLALEKQLSAGEMDFIAGKWLGIKVLDIGLDFAISISQVIQPKVVVRELNQTDVTFSGNMPELLLIASGKEDPDSLFFQRKLLIEGDTELGLEVKNLLLAIELASLPKPVGMAINTLLCSLETLKAQATMAKTA